LPPTLARLAALLGRGTAALLLACRRVAPGLEDAFEVRQLGLAVYAAGFAGAFTSARRVIGRAWLRLVARLFFPLCGWRGYSRPIFSYS
jgi:hypothetical protein